MTARQMKAARRLAGLTVEAVAARVGVTVSTWHAWEQGARVPGNQLPEADRLNLEERIRAALTK